MRAKKFVSIILSLLIVCSSFAGLAVFAEKTNKNERIKDVVSVGADVSVKDVSAETSGTTGDCTWTYDESTKTLTISGDGEMESYHSYNSSPWYNIRNNIEKIIIENGVTNITDYAFYSCQNLIKVTIPKSLTSIGIESFCACVKLIEVIICDNVINIGSNAFYGCRSLNSVTIGNSVKYIGKNSFFECVNLRKLKIGNSVIGIDDNAFYGCKELTNVTIPDSVKCIGYGAFSDCTGIINVKIGNGVINIENGSFSRCKKLTNIVMGSGIEYIGERAFADCISLNDVYYGRSKNYWNNIRIENYNTCLTGATIHYNCLGYNQKITGVKKQYVTSAGKTFSLNAKAKTKLTYTSSNKNVAVVSSTGKVTVKGGGCAYITVKASENGNYKSATVKTKIISAPRNFTSKDVSKVKKTGKTKAKITWKALTGATGYTVQLATNKSYKGAKTVKNSRNSATLTGLKKGKTYYVRINAYAKVSGKNYSNKWYTVKFKM